MSEQRRKFDHSFSEFALPEDDYHHIEYEEHAVVACHHSLEFWVAVQAARGNGERMVIQWCMRCQSAEMLTWETYQLRKETGQEHKHDDITNYRDTEL